MQKENAGQTVSKRFAYGYGLGEFGFTFFNFFVAYYLMYFLTDVLCLPMAAAAGVYSVIQWVEVFTMLAAGILIDRSRPKAGKYRPWMISGSILCAVSLTLFYRNYHLGTASAVVLFSVFYVLCYCGYNVMWVSYRTLLNPLCRSPRDGVVFSMASSQLSSLAGLIFSIVGARLLYGFADMETGYLVSAFLYGMIMVASMLLCAHHVKPYDHGADGASGERKDAVTVRELLRGLNRPMVVFFLAVTFREAVQTIFPTLLVYFFTYTIGDAGRLSIYLTTSTVTTLVGYTFADRLAVKFGKRTMFLVSSLVACAALICMNLTGSALAPFLMLTVVYMFCSIFSGAMIPAFMNDIAVYNEATYGLRGHAFNSAIGGSAIRLSQVLGGTMASFGLLLIGYSGSGDMAPGVASRITGLMTWGSAAVLLVSTAIFWFYRLDDQTLEAAYARKNDNGK